jgi:predicted acylesterase/phospholipase RssA
LSRANITVDHLDPGIKPDCVDGNSMGAIIGSLYATAPDAELKPRFQNVMTKYKEMLNRRLVTVLCWDH